MLSINLLPAGSRPAEGTPPLRLAVIMTSVVMACGLAVLNGKFYTVDIPVEKNEIKACDAQIADLSKKVEEVKKIEQEIATIKDKVIVLSNLEYSRMRYGRLLDRLCNCMPAGVWFTTFAVSADPRKSDFYPQELGGKRYQIALSGWTTGDSILESDTHLTELLNNMRVQFSVPKEPEPPKFLSVATPQEGWGLDKTLGARFDPPTLLNITTGLPPSFSDPKKVVTQPAHGQIFRIHFDFEMPAIKN
jgi:Tfp pilus assembly protein PilN